MHLTAPSHWSRSIGTSGRDPPEWVVTIVGMRKLAGIDVNAKIAELRADLELKAQGISELAAVKARNLALIASLFVGASIFLLLALIVGLVALFHWESCITGPT
jgi:hypothetical protein